MAIKFEVIDVRANVISASIEKVQAEKESGSLLIGIEVTEKIFADLMDFNIDPQHSENADSKMSAIKWIMNNGFSAINKISFNCDINNIVLYTIRPDLDSVGSMYLISQTIKEMTNYGYVIYEYPAVNVDYIELIHTADCFIGKGEWKPNMLGQGYNNSILAPVARMVQDFKIPLEKRVELIGEWLITGKFEGISVYENAVEKEKAEIISALENGETKIQYYGQWFDDINHYYRLDINDKDFEEYGDESFISTENLVIVESRLRAATSIGYDKCPVVICVNDKMPHRNGDGFYRKFTICQFNEGWVDLQKVKEELSELEDGWGGSPLIIGSPQERDSNLELIQVAEIVAKYLK